jgi:hypothetical protein
MLGWPIEGFTKAFDEVLGQGLVKADFDAPLIFVPDAIQSNHPQSPNVVVGWGKTLSEIPDCELKVTVCQTLKAVIDGLGKAFQKAFVESCEKPFLNQEQEQESRSSIQEIDTALRASATDVATPYSQFMAIWNSNCGTLAQVIQITRDREKKLRGKMKANADFDQQFCEAVKVAARTPFLCGESETGWRADFDWLIDNTTKVLEGSYGPASSKRKNGAAFHSSDSSRFKNRKPDVVMG